jgi:Asp-tRNA(Asn)/Glu-tRNA(Gln) amidotransferase A subunit family amidase
MINADSSDVPRRRRLSSGALQRLEIAIRLAEVADPTANAELRDAVHEQARHLRDQGETVERVVSEIKREVNETLARTGAMRGDSDGARALLDQVVHWAGEVRARAD